MMNSKQVIVMRKFGKGLRTGKYVAQGSHASVGALLSLGNVVEIDRIPHLTIPLNDPFVHSWIIGSFKKITCYVNSEEELQEVYEKAKAAGLPVSSIIDSGLTEFNGEPTFTAVGIGPGDPALIDSVTGKLPLF